MSPTVLKVGSFRFFFFSREEPRIHVHVQAPQGEAKFWLDPEIELAHSVGLSGPALTSIEKLVRRHESAIRAAWQAHFGT